MSYIQEVLMTVPPYLSQIVALFHMLPPKFANIQYGGQTGLESNALINCWIIQQINGDTLST